MTVFTVDLNRRVSMLEGALIWDCDRDSNASCRWYVGENVYDVFNRLNSGLPEGQMPDFLIPLESILTGEVTATFQEHQIGMENREQVCFRVTDHPQAEDGIAHVSSQFLVKMTARQITAAISSRE